MKNKRYPLWVVPLFVVAITIAFQSYSPEALAAHWTTVKDPETGKMVTLRKGETLEDYRAKEGHDTI
ncbi:MAG: hypothetical protein KAR12_08470, partial [Methylococcales bacterium]|nr:hypothetical protein [Methylococcales bacterium]